MSKNNEVGDLSEIEKDGAIKQEDVIKDSDTVEETIEDIKVDEEVKAEEPKTVDVETEEPKVEDVKQENIEPYIDNNLIGKQQKRKKILKITGITVAGILAVVYLGFVIFFSNHFFFDTSVDGIDVSLKSVSDVNRLLADKATNYSIKLHEIDGDEAVVTGSDADIHMKVITNASDICKKQNPFSWIYASYSHYDYAIEVEATYDEDKLVDYLYSLDLMDRANMESPENATFKYFDGEFQIVEAVEGSTVKKDDFIDAVSMAIESGLYELDLDEANVYEKPKYYSDADKVQSALHTLNDYADIVITYKLGEEKTVVVDGDDINKWLTVNSNYHVTYNKSKIGKFVHEFAEKYDTYGTERTFTTSLHKEIKVLGKKMGWEIDQESEIAALEDILKDGYSVHRTPVYLQEGYTYGEENDIGDTYVEVDLTNQHLYAYKEGRLIVETDIVSGCVAQRHTTPGGLYQIKYKQSPAVLRGEKNADGVPSYESHVTYWMPFNGGIGLHDADGWRSRYGGDIYLRSGSHGCVNMPRTAASEVYKDFDAGTPVVCYYYDDETDK